MPRHYNFSAGPAALPQPVIEQMRDELLDWNDQGASVMEISHRSEPLLALLKTVEADFRELLGIPDNYRVLFLPGGATAQFSMLPLNLLGDKSSVDYVNGGYWSQKAITEAERYCDVNVVTSLITEQPFHVAPVSEWKLNPDSAYLHYTSNETIEGVQFNNIPDVEIPLVSDFSSEILSREIDVSRFGLIYACAQKNFGIAGITLVIVREDLIHQPSPLLPSIFRYGLQSEKGSLVNTPPTFPIYVTGLVLKWLLGLGGITAIEAVNRRKAEKLYEFIDSDDFYCNPVAPEWRSMMNAVFKLADDSLTADFITQAKAVGLINLKGHRSVGGIRISMYNALPESAIDQLIEFMADFKQSRG